MKVMIDVPKKTVVKFVDNNNETIVRTLLSNKEYCITAKDGRQIFGTILELIEDENPSVVFDIVMRPGHMNVMENNNLVIPVGEIDNIEPVTSKYEKANRTILKGTDPEDGIETFTFKFKTKKFPTPYKISVYSGEFIALSVAGKEVDGVPGKPVSLYGEITDVDLENFIIKFKRYISNKGARRIIETNVDINKLNGVYRQNLEFCFATPEEPEDNTAECNCEDCDGNCDCNK